ncbi:MAG: hypothetical protein IKX99_03305 [Lachnospiraceae bacterium]|nr:hypothetical protein [Lachnospiraceae bacterium]MBR4795817.1 hypothetical protein [Lachnospiraceae bacterium]MBR5789116.1 hypothetical protein [Lachnospiraceae bacterium]
MDERLELIEKLKNAKVEYELTEEERAFKNRYEKELKALALENTYEKMLPIVYKLAKEYVGKGELLQDIVQEANLYVLENIERLEGIMSREEGDFIKALEDDIERMICEYLMLDVTTAMENRKVLDKLNQLLEAVESLKEQNAEYSVEDLSEFLDIEVNEIENLLRIAGEME